MAQPNIPADFDFTDPDIYENRMPYEEFAEMRKSAPVWWCRQSPEVGGFADEGYWVVTKHADVREVSSHDEIFSSWQNTAIVRFQDGIPRENIDIQRHLIINKDGPELTKLRKIISRGFTPRAVASLRSALAERAERIVTEAANSESGDFVTQVAAELPLQAIADLLGVPQEDRNKIFDWSNEMMGYDDPDYDADPETASAQLLGYAYEMAEERKVCPRNDIATTLVQADVHGSGLTPEEFGFFVLALSVAGNETTRNAIAHGMIAFLDNPDQWELFKETRPKSAVDEIVRWATPVVAFQRTALIDTELGGQRIKAGDRVAMFYGSANFDEDVFENPTKFDILRDPNPHLSFGGTGAHYCLGANLARLEIELIFNAIADQIPDIAKLSDPRRLRSGWLNGIKEFQVEYSPAAASCPARG